MIKLIRYHVKVDDRSGFNPHGFEPWLVLERESMREILRVDGGLKLVEVRRAVKAKLPPAGRRRIPRA